MDNYLNSVQLPVNPYMNQYGYADEGRQFLTDVRMARYNNEVHQAELYKQRQWALEDANYNAPAALRKRLEEAGYNPSLMAGAVQTANAPVRGASANSPSGQSSNMAAYGANKNAQVANILQAGKNLGESFVQAQTLKNIRADTNLKNSQSVKALSESAMTNQQRSQANDLFQTQKQVMIQDLLGKEWDNKTKERYYEELMPESIKNLKQDRLHSEADVKRIQAEVKNFYSQINQRMVQNKYTNAQIDFVNAETKRIVNENETWNPEREKDRKQIEYELEQLELKLRKQGIDPQGGGIIESFKRLLWYIAERSD